MFVKLLSSLQDLSLRVFSIVFGLCRWVPLSAALLFLLFAGQSANAQDTRKEIKVQMYFTSSKGVGDYVGTITVKKIMVRVAGKKEVALLFKPDMKGVKPRGYAFHVHEIPKCGPAEKNGKMVPGLGSGTHLWLVGTGDKKDVVFTSHLGDLPDLYADSEGNITKPVLAVRLSMSDVTNRALMLHASVDDKSPRYVCGVIK